MGHNAFPKILSAACCTGGILAIGIAFGSMQASPQVTAPSARLAFEAATVKLTGPENGELGTFLTSAGGRMTLRGCILKMIIFNAYKVQDYQVVNAPAWAEQQRYSIEAVPPAIPALANYNPSSPKLRPPDEDLAMLQTLLAERFHLQVHEETREGPGFALVRGDRPLKLDESLNKDAFPVVVYGRSDPPEEPYSYRQGFNVTMTEVANRFSGDLKAPVIDQTGLSGAFDFKFRTDPDPSDPTPGGYLFTAIQQIGLKLKPARVPVRYIVIDHVEKPTLD